MVCVRPETHAKLFSLRVSPNESIDKVINRHLPKIEKETTSTIEEKGAE